MTSKQEREAFEKWVSLDGRWPQAIERDSTGVTYKYLGAQKDWTAWQARAAIEAERQAMRDPVEADTEDLIKRLLDAQQDINLAANEHMSQPLCDASALIDEIEQVLRRLSTRPQQIPEGWQLVPKEPTKEMESAGACAARKYYERTGGNSPYLIYQAMLAAAPQPEEQP